MNTTLVTKQIPLFDNSRDENGRRLDHREHVMEGAVTFGRDGSVILGAKGYLYPSTIPSHEFAGCTASRSTPDGVLVIETPTGDAWRYVYSQFEKNWYRLVASEAPLSFFAMCRYVMTRSCKEAGVVVGIPYAFVLIGILVVKEVFFWGAVCLSAVLCGGVTACGVNVIYEHLGRESVLQMSKVLWIVEGALFASAFLVDFAGSGGWFWKYVAPFILLLIVGYVTTWVFPDWGVFLHTLSLFLHPTFR